jgi:hypothetical protein
MKMFYCPELCGLPYMWRSISYSFILNPQYMNRFQFCIYLVWYFGIQYLSEIYKIHNSSSGKDDNVCSTLIDCKSQILLQMACYRTKLQILFNILDVHWWINNWRKKLFTDVSESWFLHVRGHNGNFFRFYLTYLPLSL